MVGRSSDGVLSRPLRSSRNVVLLLSFLLSVFLACSPGEAASTIGSKEAKEKLPIIGNKKSRIYHRPDCPNYKQISKGHRVVFGNEKEAKAAGYRLAKNCP